MLLLLGLLPAAQAATIAVPGDYSTIQDAVDAASPGDTITLGASSFNESVIIGKDLALLGTTGTEIEADGLMALVIQSGASVSVESVELIPGDRGIYVQAGAFLTIADVTISGHSTGANGVAAAVAGNLIFNSCDFSSLDAEDGYGGAIYALPGSTVSGTSNTFDSNNAQSGGAVWAEDAAFSCTSCTFTSNTAVATTDSNATGGAIFVEGSEDLTLSNCTFSDNEADTGGAIRWVPSATSGDVPVLTLSESRLDSNLADGLGGALSVEGSGSALFTDLSVISNTAAGGGGMHLALDDESVLRRVTLCDNIASSGDGGGLFLSDGTWTLSNILLQENASSSKGGGLWAGEVELELAHSHVLSNSGASGSGIYGLFTTLTLVNDVLGWHAGSSAVETSDAELEVSTNTWYGNSVADIGGDLTWSDLDSSNVVVDPELSNYSNDGDCTNDVLWPELGSPLVDAGDITWPDDPDETRCDVGAYGGPYASPAAYADADGDAWIAMFDCNDEDASTSPSADEYCDEVDNDCNGDVDDDALDGRTWHQDLDADTWADPDATTWACERPDATWVYVFDTSEGMDCDDENDAIYPGALEYCDGVDEDCDGEIDDEAVDAPWWHLDEDGDGFGLFDVTMQSCEQPAGWVADGDYDCDDTDEAINPEAEEVCDGIDNDCDTSVDGSNATDAVNYYLDGDGDGFGNPEVRQLACDKPEGYVRNRRDCDDSDPAIHPDAEEIWYDAVDQDCAEDDDFDQDHDGHARIPDGADCDDTDPGIHPGATELAGDGIDQDCDGEDLEPEKTGCSTAPTSPWWLVLAPLALVLRRKR